MSDVTVRDRPERTRYEAVVDDEVAGYIVYRPGDGFVTMVHTEVEPEWEGHGVGSALAAGALDDVRARGLHVRVVCPFVGSFIERHHEYADLVTT